PLPPSRKAPQLSSSPPPQRPTTAPQPPSSPPPPQHHALGHAVQDPTVLSTTKTDTPSHYMPASPLVSDENTSLGCHAMSAHAFPRSPPAVTTLQLTVFTCEHA
ncbi:mucin-7-like, partial [Nilaparvata lugens]|uniref:mucin-7-like n=1 Tax=Nilaparvata lugens TaxID=108931 RepID=UPI00193DC923